MRPSRPRRVVVRPRLGDNRPMQHPRIYTPAALRTGTTHTLPESAAAHVMRVLRLAAGDPITLFDGSGMDYEAVLRVVARSGVSAEIGDGREVHRESPLAVTLLQGISRGSRMDTVVQKATELGVRVIQPVLAERTVVRLDAERSASRLEHWQRIVISACEQCGRSVVPEVRPPPSLDATLAGLEPGTTGLTLDPAGTGQIDELLGTTTRVALAIGPEGGFTANEIKALTGAGFGACASGRASCARRPRRSRRCAILQYAGATSAVRLAVGAASAATTALQPGLLRGYVVGGRGQPLAACREDPLRAGQGLSRHRPLQWRCSVPPPEYRPFKAHASEPMPGSSGRSTAAAGRVRAPAVDIATLNLPLPTTFSPPHPLRRSAARPVRVRQRV